MSHLTDAHLLTLKNDINANPTLAGYWAAGNIAALITWYNGASTTYVWRPAISIDELNTAIVWSEFAGFTSAKQNCYIAMVQGAIDATKSNIRNGFGSIFSGNNSVSLANLTALSRRLGTRLEVLISVVDGTSNTSAVFGTVCDQNDIYNAMGL